jgi:hypothetical protein
VRDFTKYKFEWLRALLADKTTRGIAHDVGSLLATHYFNATSGEAWPSIDTLAEDLNISRRGCIDGLNKLINGGWLEYERGGGIRSTRYWLPDRIPIKRRSKKTPPASTQTSAAERTGSGQTSAVQPPNRCSPASKPVHSDVEDQCSGLHPNREGIIKNREEERARASRRASPQPPRFSNQVKNSLHGDQDKQPGQDKQPVHQRKQPRITKQPRTRKSGMPDGWTLSNEEIAVAHRLAGWDLVKAEDEFAKFKNWHMSKSITSAKWSAAWETWCRRGRDYEAKQDRKPISGLQSGILGIKDWLDEQKQKNLH